MSHAVSHRFVGNHSLWPCTLPNSLHRIQVLKSDHELQLEELRSALDFRILRHCCCKHHLLAPLQLVFPFRMFLHSTPEACQHEVLDPSILHWLEIALGLEAAMICDRNFLTLLYGGSISLYLYIHASNKIWPPNDPNACLCGLMSSGAVCGHYLNINSSKPPTNS